MSREIHLVSLGLLNKKGKGTALCGKRVKPKVPFDPAANAHKTICKGCHYALLTYHNATAREYNKILGFLQLQTEVRTKGWVK